VRFDSSGRLIAVRSGDAFSKEKLIGKYGATVKTLTEMREFNKKMTNKEYLIYLSRNLNTLEKLHWFFKYLMEYKKDIKRGGQKRRDYWQLAKETIERVEKGKMLGDCEDYAFLAREILRMQGKPAHVVGIPGHAICAWVEKKNGRWHAYSVGTFGVDINGNRYGKRVDSTKVKGYSTIKSALNSLMPKYDQGGLGLKKGRQYRLSGNKIDLLDIPKKGKQKMIKIPIDKFPYV